MTRKIRTIAVTGSAGSGKSSVCRILASLGVPVIDLDQLAREAVAPGMPAHRSIVEAFGSGVVLAGGELDRRALRERLLSDPEAKARMEGWIHPEVYRLLADRTLQMEAAGASMVVVEFPLLFETGREGDYSHVVVVHVPKDVQVARLAARDAVSIASATALVEIQMSLDRKAERADFVIDNSGTPESVRVQVEQLLEQLSNP